MSNFPAKVARFSRNERQRRERERKTYWGLRDSALWIIARTSRRILRLYLTAKNWELRERAAFSTLYLHLPLARPWRATCFGDLKAHAAVWATITISVANFQQVNLICRPPNDSIRLAFPFFLSLTKYFEHSCIVFGAHLCGLLVWACP